MYTNNDVPASIAKHPDLIEDHGSKNEPIENTASPIKLDADELKKFIEKYRPSGLLNVCFIDPNKKGGMFGHTFSLPDELNQCVKRALAENEAGKNVYFSVNPPLTAKHGKLSGTDISYIDYAHVDIDPDIEKYGNHKAARKALLESVPDIIEKYRPTLIIDSGNGLGVFWKHINPLPKEQGEAINKMLIAEFNGDPGTHNADRLMRLPFTWNYPNRSKLDKGYPAEPSEASVLHYSENSYYAPRIFEKQMVEFDMKTVSRKTSNVIQKRHKAIPPNIPHIKSALGYIDPTERRLWVNTGISLHYEFRGDDTGFYIFNEWSSRASTYKGEADCRKTWNTLNITDRPKGHQRTLGSLYDDAVAGGWNKHKAVKNNVLITDANNVVTITKAADKEVTIK